MPKDYWKLYHDRLEQHGRTQGSEEHLLRGVVGVFQGVIEEAVQDEQSRMAEYFVGINMQEVALLIRIRQGEFGHA